jgi:hypothetical protein
VPRRGALQSPRTQAPQETVEIVTGGQQEHGGGEGCVERVACVRPFASTKSPTVNHFCAHLSPPPHTAGPPPLLHTRIPLGNKARSW